jgi:hypothetical protein
MTVATISPPSDLYPLRSDEKPQRDGCLFRCGACATTILPRNVTSSPAVDGGTFYAWFCDACGLSFEWEWVHAND